MASGSKGKKARWRRRAPGRRPRKDVWMAWHARRLSWKASSRYTRVYTGAWGNASSAAASTRSAPPWKGSASCTKATFGSRSISASSLLLGRSIDRFQFGGDSPCGRLPGKLARALQSTLYQVAAKSFVAQQPADSLGQILRALGVDQQCRITGRLE